MESVLTAFSTVVLALVSLVVLHLVGVALVRAGCFPASWGGASTLLIFLLLSNLLLLWRLAGGVPFFLRVGAVCLYLSGGLSYIQIRSVLSRGYSLRILADLLDRGGSARLQVLKEGYGNGVGLRGMLSKRLGTLALLKLLHWKGTRVGPLTLLGRFSASLTAGMRQLLRLEMVG